MRIMNPGHSLLGKRNAASQSASLQGDRKNVSHPSNGVWKHFKITGQSTDRNYIVYPNLRTMPCQALLMLMSRAVRNTVKRSRYGISIRHVDTTYSYSYVFSA